jgi:hypothetical protein
MSGDVNLDPDDAQHVKIEDVLDNLPWENEQHIEIEESWTTYHGKIKQLKVETVKIPMYKAYWKGIESTVCTSRTGLLD